MDGYICERFTNLDLKEIEFCRVNDLPLEATTLVHIDECQSCMDRLANITPADQQEMRSFFEKFQERLTPATPAEYARTEERVREVISTGTRRASDQPATWGPDRRHA